MDDHVDWHFYYCLFVVTSSLSYIVIIILGILCDGDIMVVAVDKGRHDEVVQKVLDEIKRMNNGLTYFLLHPTIQKHKSNVVMEVYCKNKNGISNSLSHLPSSSVSLLKRKTRNIEMTSTNYHLEEIPVY